MVNAGDFFGNARAIFGDVRPARREHSLRDQLERTVVSISNNIAERFERGTTQELLSFLYIARGSVGEVSSMLCLFEALVASLPEFGGQI